QKGVRFKFDDECLKAFNYLKQALMDAPIIKSPRYDKPFELLCDASHNTVEVMLGQYDGNIFDVIYHASKTLNDAQQNYPMVEKEIFAVVFGCDKFRSYIS
ncbi:hypothetical protein JBE27_52275, partial [Streptomyces albiflaviniger]|nr:hypothetical protein [Streptomyces albiflaviniger]